MKSLYHPKKMFFTLFSCIFFLFCTSVTFAQSASIANRVLAAEEFRRGVQSYYRGTFNESVLLFEKALSYIPGEPLILDWLGRAYYRTGVVGSALQQWQFALSSGYGGSLLSERIDIVHERRTIRPDLTQTTRFVEAGFIAGTVGQNRLFRQPVGIVALDDGSYWVTAYGSNELLHFDVNGVIITRSRGSVSGFDRPFDLLRLPDGRMLISEVGADRVSIVSSDGVFQRSFGTKGRLNGQFLGPQFMAVDTLGNVYVTDYGNSRVVVFNPEGIPLFTFGTKSSYFQGFKAIGGIAFIQNRLYIADTLTGALHVFDTSGNFIQTLLPEGYIVQSESIRVWNEYLLIAQNNRILVVDPYSGASFDLARLGNAPLRLTSAVPDTNGNLLATDYKGNTVQILSRMSELAGGMFVQIERVYSEMFPKVTLEVRVEDRSRNPIVGLNVSNFLITEEKRPVAEYKFLGASYKETYCDITILIDRSLGSDRYLEQIKTAISSIASAMNGKGTLRIVSAGSIPVQEGSGSPETGVWNALRLSAPASARWAFDLGLRLSVNDLITASKKRAVVFLSTGTLSDTSFVRYGLNDLSAYLANNGVLFSVVYLDPPRPLGELEYLVQQSGGKSYTLYRNEGLSAVVSDIISAPNGVYVLSYSSILPTDFGKQYLSVEVETYVMNRSGRDEIGYFAPLE